MSDTTSTNGTNGNGASLLLAQVVDAARELSRHDDPAAVMRLAHRVDMNLMESPLRWWMRMAVLHWIK